ncbi:MAG: sugar phosphate isomerase/epimerase family protein [Clostridia bacterium]|nr:sugar phosphate isomerase/epimerase family protein [Clostridia bacterium]
MNIGVSTLLHETADIVTATEVIAGYGFTRIELFCELDGFHPESILPATIDRLQGLASKHGLIYSIHPPCAHNNPASSDPQLRRQTVADYRGSLQLAARLGAKDMVVHSGHKSSPDVGDAQAFAFSCETMRAVSDTANDLGVRLMLENTGWSELRFLRTPDDLMTLAEACPPDTGLLLDTGHAVLQGFDPAACAVAWMSRLVQIHAHDNRGQSDEHLAVGAGVIDWSALLALLRTADWDGVFMIEVGECSEPAKALAASIRAIGERVPAALCDCLRKGGL